MDTVCAGIYLIALILFNADAFIPGVDGPISTQEALEGKNTTLICDSATNLNKDEFILLVWYKDNVPVYSYDARDGTEWSSAWFNESHRMTAIRGPPAALTIRELQADDQALYHCRVDFTLSPTRNQAVNLTVIVLPSQPFFLDENGNKVENTVGPYYEGDVLVISCLVIGGRPPPRIVWYSGETLVDADDSTSDIPGVRENVLRLPLARDSAAPLTCRAANTHLAKPIVTSLQVELLLLAYNVSIHWVEGASADHSLQAGKPATAECQAVGAYPKPELSWWLNERHLTQHSNQSWSNSSQIAVSRLQLIPSVLDNDATFACIVTNAAMKTDQDSRAHVVRLNVTYSPIVEVINLGGSINQIVERDPLNLECEVRANPSVERFTWYYNDREIISHDLWGMDTTSHTLEIAEARRQLEGSYSCSARNSMGETRAEPINITILYPPECSGQGISLNKETLHCNVKALPMPDIYFWHVQPAGLDTQNITTGSAILPLSQLSGSLNTLLKVTCEANNGVASQETSCQKTLSLEHLRPLQPQQCDIAFEYEEFQMRCMPVENATYYEATVWRMSSSNASLILEHRGLMGISGSQALGQGGQWLVRGGLGQLRSGDEAGAAACNRYGCSRATLLRPTEIILQAGERPWWHYLLEKDVGMALGGVVLMVLFVLTTALTVRWARRRRRANPPPPIIQVLQLDDAAREYLDYIGEQRLRSSRSLRSSTVYSSGSLERAGLGTDRHHRLGDRWDPPPDVTLTLHRESAV